MTQLIMWTVVGGSIVFIIGLISAIGSRMKRGATTIESARSSAGRVSHVFTPAETVSLEIKNANPKTAMSMAAEGTGNVSVTAFNGNAEANLASIGSHSR